MEMKRSNTKNSSKKMSKHHFLKRNITLINKMASEDKEYGNFFSFLEKQNSTENPCVPTHKLLKPKIQNFTQLFFNFKRVNFNCSPLTKKHNKLLQSKLKVAQFINHN